MAIVRVDPFHEFATLQNRVDRMFGGVLGRDESGSRTWIPPVDIYEDENRDVVITADLPDVTREQIEVTVEHDTLTLKGTRQAPSNIKEEQFRRVERRYGAFSRSFTLPETVDATKVTAEHKNGVLTVRLPYREESKPRSIRVEVAA
ncbi:MAG: Hsp20/alpha crystallin family protein [Acidobacteria bacterium]|nr:Hsp20/alpha crystallin family protein [Acidobacteriota bacterium]